MHAGAAHAYTAHTGPRRARDQAHNQRANSERRAGRLAYLPAQSRRHDIHTTPGGCLGRAAGRPCARAPPLRAARHPSAASVAHRQPAARAREGATVSHALNHSDRSKRARRSLSRAANSGCRRTLTMEGTPTPSDAAHPDAGVTATARGCDQGATNPRQEQSSIHARCWRVTATAPAQGCGKPAPRATPDPRPLLTTYQPRATHAARPGRVRWDLAEGTRRVEKAVSAGVFTTLKTATL